MMSILKTIINAVFSLLPDSPFRGMIDSVLYEFDLLPNLNWFLPFDICSQMTLVWLDCILIYYLFVMVKKIVIDIILPKVLSLISVAVSGLSK